MYTRSLALGAAIPLSRLPATMPPQPPPPPAASLLAPDSISSSGLSSDRLSLPALQSRMKLDPTSYAAELRLQRAHFASALHLFRARSALAPTTADPAASKDLGDLAMFLSHVAPFYPGELAELPAELAELLRDEARQLPSSLRCHLAQALILLVNRKLVGMDETLELFMDLQILGDRTLRKLAFSHVVHSIRRMNQKHKDEAKNRKLQNVLFLMLQGEDELRAKRSLIVLCDLHRRRVWLDDRTANAICNGCFHTSSRIMIAALSFLLGYEQVQEADDSDDSSSEDDTTNQQPQLVLSRETIYKAHHKGTTASKKKKKAKLQRVIRSMKRQQRVSSEKTSSNWYSPLTHLKDAQGFAEKLFSRLQKCNERFEVKMMMLKVIARTVGLHRLILLNLYPFLQKYVQPHQRDITELLAAAVQACHDMVPPDAVEPLFKQIVNQFVHDRSRTEAIAVGLNVVREICLRMPLLMNEDLLQDLVLYKKSHEKAISTAARSLMTLFREICPSLLVKKDRGRPIDPKARPKAFGEVSVASHVPGVELLDHDDGSSSNSSDDEPRNSDIEDEVNQSTLGSEAENDAVEDDGEEEEDLISEEEDSGEQSGEGKEELEGGSTSDEDDNDGDSDDGIDDHFDEDDSNDDECNSEDANDNEDTVGKLIAQRKENGSEDDDDMSNEEDNDDHKKDGGKKLQAVKRKFMDYSGQLNAADASLRALKRLAGSKIAPSLSEETDGILSNEDFQRIKELKAKKEAKHALTQHGLLKKLPSSEQLSMKRVDPAQLEVNIKTKLSKEERLALVRAGREDRGKYQARTAVKQKKTGGLSNRQKEHKKAMPLAAKKAKAARSRQEKRKQQRKGGKQFRGKKAWK